MFEKPATEELLGQNEWRELIRSLRDKSEALAIIQAIDRQMRLIEGGKEDAKKSLKEATETPKYPWRELITDLGRDVVVLKQLRRLAETRLSSLPEA